MRTRPPCDVRGARGARDPRGSVTIVSAAVMALALVLCLGFSDLTRVFVARSRARAAADAAALAAAQELAFPSGGDAPGAVAAAYAAANGARLVACACEPGTTEARVEAVATATGLALVPGDVDVTIRARAVVEPIGGTSPSPSP